MPAAALPPDEPQRLDALRRYALLDSAPERAYQDLLAIAAGICGTPMAAVSLVDAERQWFKARIGLDVAETPRASSFCAHAILDPDNVLIVEDASNDPRFLDNPLVTAEPGIRFYAGAPLVGSDGSALGSLCVLDNAPRAMSPFQRKALSSLAHQVGALMELRLAYRDLHHHLEEREWFEQQLRARNDELTAQSLTDALTGLPNRRAFDRELADALSTARRESVPVWLGLADIDHFKGVNDRHGHPTGDRCLVAVAAAIRADAAENVFVARCGGEEFGIVLVGVDGASAFDHCESMRRRVAADASVVPVTISVGLSALRPDEDAIGLTLRADQALYRAKQAGRDRVVVD